MAVSSKALEPLEGTYFDEGLCEDGDVGEFLPDELCRRKTLL